MQRESFDFLVTDSITDMIRDCATMLTVANAKQSDGTHVKAVINRNTGKKYTLEGQLVRNASNGRFAKLSEALA